MEPGTVKFTCQGSEIYTYPRKVDRVQKFKDVLRFARKLRLAIFFYRRSQEGGGGGGVGKYQKVQSIHGPRQMNLIQCLEKTWV